VSAIKIYPDALTATPNGPLKDALVADPPSPREPGVTAVPATAVTMPPSTPLTETDNSRLSKVLRRRSNTDDDIFCIDVPATDEAIEAWVVSVGDDATSR